MRREERLVNFPSANQVGTGASVVDFNGGWIGLDGSWMGTVDVEGLLSADLSTWVSIASNVASASVVEVKASFAMVRVNGTNMTAPSGAKAKFVGFNTRSR